MRWRCLLRGHLWRLRDAGNARTCDRCGHVQIRLALDIGNNRWTGV